MNRINKLLAEMCPDGVVNYPLGELLKNSNAENKIAKKDYSTKGSIPIIDQSMSLVAGYTNDESAIPPKIPCIIFGDHTRIVKYADQQFAQGDSGTKVFVSVSPAFNIDRKSVV